MASRPRGKEEHANNGANGNALDGSGSARSFLRETIGSTYSHPLREREREEARTG